MPAGSTRAGAAETRVMSDSSPQRDLGAEASLLDVANLLLRRGRLVASCGLAGAVVFAAISLVVPPTYVAHTAFIQAEPSRGVLPGSLGALASRFGVSGAAGATTSLD